MVCGNAGNFRGSLRTFPLQFLQPAAAALTLASNTVVDPCRMWQVAQRRCPPAPAGDNQGHGL